MSNCLYTIIDILILVRIKILIVDDNDNLLTLYKLFLSEFEVITASNGKEAVEIYRKEKPDIVIIDIKMPEMNGIEATKRIKGINENAKIIGATAYHDKYADEMLKIGALEVMKKPFEMKELVKKIKKYSGA